MPSISKVTVTKKPSPKGVLDRISSVQDIEVPGSSWLIYGKSGSGKSTTHSSWPKPSLVVVCSGGDETKSIRNVKGIDAVQISDEAELAELVEYQKKTNKYKTFVIDHATDYQSLVFKKVIGRDAPVQMGWGTATREQWGEIALGVKERLKSAIDLPCETVIVAQEKTFNVEESDSDLLDPYINAFLSPSISAWLGPSVDYAIQCYVRLRKETIEVKKGANTIKKDVDRIEYVARIGPHPIYYTKFRKPKERELPEVLVNPTYDQLIKIANG